MARLQRDPTLTAGQWILDFGLGTGHLASALSTGAPNCTVTWVEGGRYSLRRLEAQGFATVRISAQSVYDLMP